MARAVKVYHSPVDSILSGIVLDDKEAKPVRAAGESSAKEEIRTEDQGRLRNIHRLGD